MRKTIRKIVKSSLVVILVAVLLGSALVLNSPTDDYFMFGMIARFFLTGLLGYLLIFYNAPLKAQYDFLKSVVKFGIPTLVSIILVTTTVWPEFGAQITKEDYWLEILQPLLFFISSILFLLLSVRFLIKRQIASWLIATTAVITLFVMGMEEISWMQRILEIESSEFFLENNAQDETNLHNFASIFFNAAYHLAVFALLVLAPFYHRHIASWVSKSKLAFIERFIPSAWLFIPFAATVGLLNATHSSVVSFIFILTFTTLLLFYKAYLFDKESQHANSLWLILIATILIASYIIGGLIGPLKNTHSPMELRETFAAIGVLVYTIDVYIRHSVKDVANAEFSKSAKKNQATT